MEFKYVTKYMTGEGRKWLVLLLSFWVTSFFVNIWPVVFLAMLCIFNVLLMLYDRYVDLPIDIELSTFSAVLMATKFGVGWGIAAGVLTKLAAIISNRDFNGNSVLSMTSYCLAAVIASFVSGPIMTVGLVVVVLVNVYSFIVMRFLLQESPYQIISYSVTNLIFNFIVFFGFADILFRIIPAII